MRAVAHRDSSAAPMHSHLSSKSSGHFRSDVAAASPGVVPSLRRPQGHLPRQSLVSGKPWLRHLSNALKFPGATEEERDSERAVAILEPKAASDIRDDEGDDLPGPVEPKSSLDRIELQAKESLSKLKHLLYKLKSRQEGDVTSTIVTSPAAPSSDQPTVLGDEKQIFVSQKIEVDLSKPMESSIDVAATEVVESLNELIPGTQGFLGAGNGAALDLPGLKKGLEFQLDALTSTRAIVTFDDATQTAVVTVTATVRAAEFQDKGSYSEKAIALATRALARTCLELDEKAQASGTATVGGSAVKFTAVPTTIAGTESHQKIQRALLSASVVSWQLATPEFGCTPFRPVYVVKLQLLDGSSMEAIFKPCLPGDRLLRWKRAPEDWVAYQLSSVLGMDVVPPAVMRSGLTLGDKTFDLGVLILKPQSLTRLENADPSRTQGSQTVVSDIRILDALLGNALRPHDSFLATSEHWSGQEEGDQQFYPLMVGQPMGPKQGSALHSMWTPANNKTGSFPAVQVVSRETASKLKGLTRGVLLEVFGGVLNAEEIDMLLSKRDHLLAYLEGLARRHGSSAVCV